MPRISSHGIVLKMSDMAATPVFTAIAQIISLTPPGWQRGETEAVDHDLTAAKEYLNDALYEQGEVTFGIHWDPAHATHDETTGLIEAAVSGDPTDFQIIFPDTGATQFDFSAFVRFQPGSFDANAGKMTADVTLRPTGTIAVS